MNKLFYEYIVIGAGPAGLQMGYFLKKENMDYRILEREDGCASFFKNFPRHRKLISINKIFTGYTDPEVNLRWDWNSLICDNSELRLKNYSREYFPNADDFTRYLEDFSNHYNLNISYNSNAQNIKKGKDGLFYITCGEIIYTCKYLIVASGVPCQIIPEIEGMELCETYTSCSIDPENYSNQKVLIIGKGNSGFEMADSLVATAKVIHILGPNNVEFAWKTHYVGHLRALNNNFLDTYLLKSQNAILNGEVLKIWKDVNGKYVVKINYTKVKDAEIEDITYDRVILACGFKMDSSFFNSKHLPDFFNNGKFPQLTCEWESTNIKDLYFAGILTHSRDFRKATSGFIHGFRYNCEALKKILIKKNMGKELDFIILDSKDVLSITEVIIQKINTSSALWQQFGFLGDAIIFERTSSSAKYYDALPCDYIHEILGLEASSYLIITLEYGLAHRDSFASNVERINRFDVDSAAESDFLHPVVRRYSIGNLMTEVHLIEDLNGEFNRKEHFEPLYKFLKNELFVENEIT